MKTSQAVALIFLVTSFGFNGAFAENAKKHTSQAQGKPLTLIGYLDEVRNSHLGIRASEQAARAARETSFESATLTTPALLATGTQTSEGRSNPFSPDDHFATQNLSVGVSEVTKFGLAGKLSFNYSGLSAAGYPSYNANYGTLELSQSLLRNWGGAEITSQAAAIEAAALAKSFTQSYQARALTLEAEANYWRLALTRDLVQMQIDAVDRARKIYDWTSRRAKLQLTDRADTLQASTNLQARQLDLRTARDDERAAAQAFNGSRGIHADEVAENLVDLNPSVVATMKIPERKSRRDDILAAEFQARAASTSALLSREKDKPTFEIFGSALLTEPTAPPAQLAAVIPATSRPATTVGVRLNAPLDFSILAKAREGYAAEAQAADMSFQRKLFEEDRDWRDLTAKFRESADRYKMYVELERSQKEKLDYERDRHSRGRSTLQQVLIFETDYASAQLGRMRTLADLLTLNAQMKMYGN